MKIGYIYLFGQEWHEWKKHNKPIPEIIQELKELNCDKIYMDIFIEEYGFPDIKRMNLKDLLEKVIFISNHTDQLIMRGESNININNQEEFENQIKKELYRIENLNIRKI